MDGPCRGASMLRLQWGKALPFFFLFFSINHFSVSWGGRDPPQPPLFFFQHQPFFSVFFVSSCDTARVGCVWSLGLTRLDWVSDLRQTVPVVAVDWVYDTVFWLYFILFFHFRVSGCYSVTLWWHKCRYGRITVSFNGKIAVFVFFQKLKKVALVR